MQLKLNDSLSISWFSTLFL